jgi:hypothetical protein
MASCGEKEMTPAEKAHWEVPCAALRNSSQAFDIWAILAGDYMTVGSDSLFVGKVLVLAKVKNNTPYTFQDVSLFIVPRDYKAVVNERGARLPDSGVLCFWDEAFSEWKPGETISLRAEIGEDARGEEFSAMEYLFEEYLTKTLRLPANEPVRIDQYVATFWGKSPASPVDCLRPDCPYKKLPRDDPLHCGE